MEGTYTPGYRLVLAKIAEDLGFSVVPVREAIRRLEAEGLVKFERNVGATVSGIDPTEYLYTMQTLSIVEGAATALSAPLIDSVAIARARAVNAEMRECLEHFDPVRFTALNQDFHSVLFRTLPQSAHSGPRAPGLEPARVARARQPSASSPAAPRSPCANTRRCCSSSKAEPTPTPSNKRPATTAPPPWTRTSPQAT